MNQHTSAQPARSRNIGGSILPSSEPRILQVHAGEFGAFQVRAMPELDTHGLFLLDPNLQFFQGNEQLLAMHPNGYSCHSLAERILAAWRKERTVAYVLEQFDYILRCGGLGKSRDTIEYIARGMPQD